MVKVKEDMTGWKMWEHGVPDSRLTVIKQVDDYIEKNGSRRAQYLCECNCGCGQPVIALAKEIKSGHTKSCGCLKFTIGKYLIEDDYLMSEFDWSKNANEPSNIALHGDTSVHWICGTCGHKWESIIISRAKGHGCPLCGGRTCVSGKNDIITKYENETNEETKNKLKELIKCFINYEDARLYTPNSNKEILMKCPDCGEIVSKSICDVFNKGFHCKICSDKISYPNKFIYSLMKQLKLDVLDREWNRPDWMRATNSSKYSFDIYFEYNGNKYVVEADGGLGHGKRKYNSAETDVDGKQRDELKEKLAHMYGINVIRIDCDYKNAAKRFDYIKNNITESELGSLFDLSVVDWQKCDMQGQRNLVKTVCEYYDKHNDNTITDIAKAFGLSVVTISSYLKRGSKFGWCSYTEQKKKENATKASSRAKMKPVIQMDMDGNEIAYYGSMMEAAKAVGVKNSSYIAQCCLGTRHFAYGFKWKYATYIEFSNDGVLT